MSCRIILKRAICSLSITPRFCLPGLMGTKVPTGAVCELLLLRQVKGDTWECLARPGKRMQPGTKVEFGDGSLTAVVDETLPDGQ